jgi:anti-sigma28 factor (negative regulator of flagellin synthesis)
MDIKNVHQSNPPVDQTERKLKHQPAQDKDAAAKKDSVQLSPEAREMQHMEKEKKLNEIRAKIDAGFYSRREVIEKVASGILKELDDNDD